MRGSITRVAVLAVILGVGGALCAVEVNSETARLAVDAWLCRGQPVKGVTESAETVVDADTGARINVVNLKGGGYVVTAGDDLRGPVMAFSDRGVFSADETNPIWQLVRADARLAPSETNAAASAGGHMKMASAPSASARTGTQLEWDELLGRSGSVPSPKKSVELPSGCFVVRKPMLETVWGQSTHNGYAESSGGLPCFDLYTPEYAEGCHSPCGCVATAGAQLMRYFSYPDRAVTNTFGCKLLGKSVYLSTSGKLYNWNAMPATPFCESERKAVGRLTSDVGIACEAEYGKSATSASIWDLCDRLKDVFKYKNAVMFDTGSDAQMFTNIIASLDAKSPVVMAIFGSPGGHAVVADGYAWDSRLRGTFYLHVDMGWTGNSTAWYVPPTFEYKDDYGTYYYIRTFNQIQGVVGNVFPKQSGMIVSGQVLGTKKYSAGGSAPVVGAVVTLASGGNIVGEALTDGNGRYAIVAPVGSYTLSAAAGGTSVDATLKVTPSKNVNVDLCLSLGTSAATPALAGASTFSDGRWTVKLACSTSGAEIRYTTDGSDPCADSELYSGKVMVASACLLKARAFKPGMAVSEVFSTAIDMPSGWSADLFANAVRVDEEKGRVELSNAGAGKETGEPNHSSGGYEGGASVWIELIPPKSGTYVLKAYGMESGESVPDTQLAVYTGSKVSALALIASNDDISSSDVSSRVILSASAGVSYKIAIDTYQGAEGTLVFEWAQGDFVSAAHDSLTVSSIFGNESVEMSSSTKWRVVEYPDWLRVTPPEGSDGDSVKLEYADNTSDSTRTGIVVFQAGDSDPYGITVNQAPSGWYTALSDAKSAATATGKRIVMVYGRDSCANTTAARQSLMNDAGVRAVVDSGFVLWYCNCDGPRNSEAYPYLNGLYSYTLPCLAVIDVSKIGNYLDRTTGYQSASSIKTLLSNNQPSNPQPVKTVTVAFDGNGGSAGTASRGYTVGSTYGTLPTATRSGFVFGGWYTGGFGGTVITTSTVVSPTLVRLYARWLPRNDAFAGAVAVSGLSGSVKGDNVNASSESGDPLPLFIDSATATVWWKWTAPVNGTVRFDTAGTAFDTVMGVYSGSSLSSLSASAENDDDDPVYTSACEFRCVAGTEYRVSVAGYEGATGLIALNWTASSVPDSYTIRFNVGGGTGTMDDMVCEPGKVVKLEPCRFTNGSLKFLGWRCSNNNRLYDDEMLVYDLAGAGGSVTMTAIWK